MNWKTGPYYKKNFKRRSFRDIAKIKGKNQKRSRYRYIVLGFQYFAEKRDCRFF